MKRFTPNTPQKTFPEPLVLEEAAVSFVPEKEQILSISRLREVEEKIEFIEKEFRKKQISDPEKIILDHFEFLDLFKISRRTSQNWRVRGRISHSLIGGRIYFTLADIQRLVEEHRAPIMNSVSSSDVILSLSKENSSAGDHILADDLENQIINPQLTD